MTRSRSEVEARLLDPGLIAVVRAKSAEQVLPLAQALIAGGITAIEITMTTPDAISAIRGAKDTLGTQALIGVGTVLNSEICRQAIAAGAEFVVSPIMRPEIVTTAHASDRVVMLGAYSPTEAQTAYEAGADFIKIFPADNLGPGFIKALLAPLPHLRIVPTGGVTLKTAPEFLKAGCAALGLGSSLISPEILQQQDWACLTVRAREFVTAVAYDRRK